MQRTPHVLVVDDHKEIRDLLAKYLAKNGLRVSTANGGRRCASSCGPPRSTWSSLIS